MLQFITLDRAAARKEKWFAVQLKKLLIKGKTFSKSIRYFSHHPPHPLLDFIRNKKTLSAAETPDGTIILPLITKKEKRKWVFRNNINVILQFTPVLIIVKEE